jgi:hypothetical protein
MGWRPGRVSFLTLLEPSRDDRTVLDAPAAALQNARFWELSGWIPPATAAACHPQLLIYIDHLSIVLT